MPDRQTFSHYPSWPLPVLQQPLTETPPHPCSYFPDRTATLRAFFAEGQTLTPDQYHAYMDAGFRRSGRLVYQPLCTTCRDCIPLRVPTAAFHLSKSLRRIQRQNADLQITIAPQQATAEKFQLYQNYRQHWHQKPAPENPRDAIADFLTFLYDSPVQTVDFEYRIGTPATPKLIAVGVCDIAPQKSLSSVYFYFDPAQSGRSLGTFSALFEILWSRQNHIPHWYAGYWVPHASTMHYKSRFHPHELLGTDGIWRPHVIPVTDANQS